MSNRTELCEVRHQLHQIEVAVGTIRWRLGERSAGTHLGTAINLLAGARSSLTEALRGRVDDVEKPMSSDQ